MFFFLKCKFQVVASGIKVLCTHQRIIPQEYTLKRITNSVLYDRMRCVTVWVLAGVLLRGDGTSRSWVLVECFYVIKGMLFIMRQQSLVLLFPGSWYTHFSLSHDPYQGYPALLLEVQSDVANWSWTEPLKSLVEIKLFSLKITISGLSL